jgi:hypothetical protein
MARRTQTEIARVAEQALSGHREAIQRSRSSRLRRMRAITHARVAPRSAVDLLIT